ncbi:unnamed protein product [Prorocentrum cordatum]|uniref:Cyclic nucleotide-binding domain-containing protein n=1 Tax=Prorocentrum cordatum TaxID=2364126 RepID=A0ABN9RMC7_9DINO|nr:unnamed protein product [Polarella glacialis]
MSKEHYNAGDVIISHETSNSGLFFVISGVVRLQLSESQDVGLGPKKPVPKRQGTLLGWALAECPSPKLPDFRRSRSASPRYGSPSKEGRGVERECRSPEFPDSCRRSRSTSPRHGPSLKDSRGGEGDRENTPTWDLGPDKVFGDMALLNGMHCGMVAVALQSTKVLRIPGHEVMRLVDRSAKVRNYVSRRAVENLRQIDRLKGFPEAVAQDLANRCPLVTFQPGQLVFQGLVDETSAIISVIFGAIEVRQATSETRRVANVNSLLCTEHLLGEASQPIVARALEPTSVLLIDQRSLAQLLPQDPRKNSNDAEALDLEAGLWAERFSAPTGASQLRGTLGGLPGQVDVMPEVLRGEDDDDVTTFSQQEVGAQAETPRIATPPLAVEPPRQPSRRERLKTVGRDLGWDTEDETSPKGSPSSKTRSDRSNFSGLHRSEDLVDEIAGMVLDGDLGGREAEAGPVRGPSNWSLMSQDGAERASPAEHDAGSAHAAIMVWLGILIDAVPESLVIGILINKSAEDGGRGFRQSAATALPFVIGVFISNLPESMSSSGSMLAHGVSRTRILLMWAATTAVTAVGAAVGALLFPPGSSGDLHVESAIAGVEGLAAGAMLTMIAQTMMPEAFEQGGDIVGLSTLAGFLCALSVKLLPLE